MYQTSCRNNLIPFGQSFTGKLNFWTSREIFPYKSNAFFLFTYNPMILKNSVVSHLIQIVSSRIQDQTLLLLEIIVTRELRKKWKIDNSQFLIIFVVVTNFSLKWFFAQQIEEPTMNTPIFWNRIKFDMFILDLKVSKWLHWSNSSILDKRKRSFVWKKPTWQEQLRLHVNYLRAQVSFRQLPAETAGIRKLRRFIPASACSYTCGTVYLRPSQVNLQEPVLQWMLRWGRIS